MAVGGQNNYPSLNTIANLVRSLVNDDKAGATGTPGEGQILTNSSVTLQNLMNSAIRETYRDVRIMGQPTLIKDNFILYGLTPVNSPLGVGAPNPATQVSLQFVGYFDGLEYNSNLALPGDLILPLEVWWRQSGTNFPFVEVPESTGPLRSRYQSIPPGQWEWRQDGIWMNGSIVPIDARLRYISTFVDLAAPNIDWSNTFVPIMDSQEAIADKIALRYQRRQIAFSPELAEVIPDLIAQAKRSTLALAQQVTRTRQKIDFQIKPFGGPRAARANYLF
ncbi:MAG: hypothetical protein ACLGXA_24420 [Acidobacteriota bacterium]